MPTTNPETRILALNIRARRFGFVVVEPSRGIIDYGVRSVRSHPNRNVASPRKKFKALLRHFYPTTMIVKKQVRSSRRKKLIERIAHEEARELRIPFRSIPDETVKRAFGGRAKNKDEIASALTKTFPELNSMLPPKRKCWQSENYWMTVFDAAALSLAYLLRSSQPAVSVPTASLGTSNSTT